MHFFLNGGGGGGGVDQSAISPNRTPPSVKSCFNGFDPRRPRSIGVGKEREMYICTRWQRERHLTWRVKAGLLLFFSSFFPFFSSFFLSVLHSFTNNSRGSRRSSSKKKKKKNVHLSCAHQRPERSHDTY